MGSVTPSCVTLGLSFLLCKMGKTTTTIIIKLPAKSVRKIQEDSFTLLADTSHMPTFCSFHPAPPPPTHPQPCSSCHLEGSFLRYPMSHRQTQLICYFLMEGCHGPPGERNQPPSTRPPGSLFFIYLLVFGAACWILIP